MAPWNEGFRNVPQKFFCFSFSGILPNSKEPGEDSFGVSIEDRGFLMKSEGKDSACCGSADSRQAEEVFHGVRDFSMKVVQDHLRGTVKISGP
jgi:hypothetical protein